MKADVTTLDAKKAGTVELSDEVFGLEPRADILHRMVRYQLAKRRAGTAASKDRSQINATTAKMYRQKGTGTLVVIENCELKEGKTKELKSRFAKLGFGSALIVDGAEVHDAFARAARNIPKVDVLPVQGINVYDILRHDTLVLTKAALEALEARFK
jgi:large subunit ribosomal protein L4